MSPRRLATVRAATGALVAGGALAVCLTATASAFAAQEPLASPVTSLEVALNASDVEFSASQFEDDAVVIQPRVGGMPQIYVGQDQIRWWLRSLIAQHVHFGIADSPRFRDDRLRWSDTLSIDAFRQLGLDMVSVESEASLGADGRIEWLSIQLTPAAARSLEAAPGGAPALTAFEQ